MQDDDDCNSSESASDVRDKADDTTNRKPTTEVKVLGRKRQSIKLNELKSEDKVAEEKYSVKKEEVKQNDKITKRRSIPHDDTESRSQDGIRAGNTKSHKVISDKHDKLSQKLSKGDTENKHSRNEHDQKILKVLDRKEDVVAEGHSNNKISETTSKEKKAVVKQDSTHTLGQLKEQSTTGHYGNENGEKTAQVEHIKQESKMVTEQSGSIEHGGEYALSAAGGVDYMQNPNIVTGGGSFRNNCEEKSQKKVNDKHKTLLEKDYSESRHEATANKNAAEDKEALKDSQGERDHASNKQAIKDQLYKPKYNGISHETVV